MIRYERDLLERQTRLRCRAASERERLAHGLEPLRPYVTLTDRALRIGRAIVSHPEWIALGVASLAVLKPRWVLRAGSRLWIAWRTARSARRVFHRLMQRVS